MVITRMDSMIARVLVIESDPLMLTAMGSALKSGGHVPVLARTEQVANDSIAAGEFDAIVLSIADTTAGCQFANRLRSFENTCDTPIIFLVDDLSGVDSQKLASQGGVFSLLKPVEPDTLLDVVEKALWLPHIANSHNHLISKRQQTRAKDWTTL